MKRIILLITLICLSSNQIFAQGGDNAASAASSPITLPFSATGTTVGRVDNYNLPNGFVDGSTTGPDWLYYFCATSTNVININLDFPVTSAGIYPSISVWHGGAPGVGTLVSSNVTSGTVVGSLGTSFTPVSGQCYYIMIDNWPTPNGFAYTLTVNNPPGPLTTQPACTNIGFDNGNFTGWQGSYGYSVKTGAANAPIPSFTPTTYNTTSSQTTITSAGNDPFAGFPMVCPGQGPNSVRLGDGAQGGIGGASLEQKFSVASSNALFTYHYAVVITDATNPVPILAADGTDSLDALGAPVYYQNYTNTGDSVSRHPSNQQPYFKVDLYDCNGNSITCGTYLVVGGAGIPGFTQIGTSSMYYKNWTSVFIDLTPYIGTCVSVKYTVADCSLGAHYCYAYVDATCAPMAIIGVDHVCPGQSTTLTSPIGGVSYSWTVVGNSTVLGTNQSYTASPLVNTTYQCVITSVTGCSTTLTFPVVVYAKPVATATSPTVCQGIAGTVTTTATPTGGSYSWTNGAGSASTFSLSPATTTSYTATYTSLDGCTDTALATIHVNPLPIAPPTTPVTYCQNQTPNSLTASVTASAGCTLNWYGTNSTGGTASATAPTVSTATATTTTYYVSQTNTATGCEGPRSSILVTVNALPTISVNSPSTCAGIAVTLTATGGTSYTWSTTPSQTGASITVSPMVPTSYTVTGTSAQGCSNSATSNVSINGSLNLTVNDTTICNGGTAVINASGATTYSWASGETTASITVSPSVTTTYSVTGTTAGCVGTVTSTVTVNPVPTVTVNSPTVCNGTAASLVATPNLTGGTYSWSPASTATATISVTPSSTTPYTVTYTLNGCQNTGTGSVTVNPVPTVTVDNQAICAGDPPATLTATPSPSGGTYLWNPSSTTASTISMSPANTTPYTVTYTLNGCSASGTGTITVNPIPNVDAGVSHSVCIGSSVTLTATGASTYVWDKNVVNGVPFTPTGTDTYTVIGTSAAGCIATDNVTITVIPLPVVSFFPSDTFGCAPLNVMFTNTTTGGATNCVWTISDGTTLNGCSTVQHTFNSAGCFDVTLTTSTPEGCSSTLTIPSLICVEARPIADFLPSPTVMPNYSTLSAMYNQSVGAVAYSWNFGDGGGSTETSPSHNFPGTEEADYLITLVAYSQSGCTDTAFVPVHIFEEVIYYVPNTFTPDGDDFNEVFLPIFSSGFDPSDYTLYIFNRWGELIFESHDPKVGWKGTFGTDGTQVQDDTYTWKIIYKHKNDKKKNVVVGHVNVLK